MSSAVSMVKQVDLHLDNDWFLSSLRKIASEEMKA